MSTDVMTPEATRRAGSRGDARQPAGRPTAAPPDARRPARPARRPRTDRPASPVLPASPVRPASPARPAGPGRPGRTIRTGGPPRQAHAGEQPDREYLTRAGGRPGLAGVERARPAGRTSFVILVLGLLSGGLVCLLVVNTTLAANSIEITRLQQANAARTEQIQQLRQQVAAASTAAVIEREARRLGMRPVPVPAFVDLRTHSIRAANATAP